MLNDIITVILEKGASAASFDRVTAAISKLEAADRVLVLLQALSRNPDLMLVRLHLAKLLWQLDCAHFALEQLQYIHRNISSSGSEALIKLIEKFGGSISNTSEGKTDVSDTTTLASVDFDIEVLDPDKL